MATSSMLENVYIQGPEEVEQFFKAVDKAMKAKPKPTKRKSKIIWLKGKELRDFNKKNG